MSAKLVDFPINPAKVEAYRFARSVIDALSDTPVGIAICIWDKDNWSVAETLLQDNNHIPILLVPEFTKAALAQTITEYLTKHRDDKPSPPDVS